MIPEDMVQASKGERQLTAPPNYAACELYQSPSWQHKFIGVVVAWMLWE